MKIIANYLPQFYSIKENDRWWGKGFTDWVSCRNAQKLFNGHVQPKEPLDDNYYSLDDVENIKWQAKIARKYGIYGFGIYHYWFNSNMNLLTEPPLLILKNKDIDINYFFIWDNNSWKKTWSVFTGGSGWNNVKEKKHEMLAEIRYGDESDWKKHFDYLLPFFKDKRYIKLNGKPIIGLFNTYNEYNTIVKMIKYWNELSKDNGIGEIIVLSRDDYKQSQFEYKFRYTPFAPTTISDYLKLKLKRIFFKERIKKYSYDRLWKNIIKRAKNSDNKTILSGFVSFDDTPRRGNNGNVVMNASPEKFYLYLKQLINIANEKGDEYLLVTAWNEWGEGCCLEPDKRNQYKYLEAIKMALEENKIANVNYEDIKK